MLEAKCRVGDALGFLVDLPFRLDDEDLRDAILNEIRSSQLVDKGVLLAFDKPYDNNGVPLEPELYTSNHWVAQICNNHRDIALFGASVHPYREDALEELENVKAQGAVLVKWIPSSQNILPNHEKCKEFYKKLVSLKLPLLCHLGDEHTIAVAGGDESLKAYNHPELLTAALEEGVTVIMAHFSLPISEEDNDFSEAFMRMMVKADVRGWRLFADVSALVGSWNRSFLAKLMALRLLYHRLVMGNDWPTPPDLNNDFRTSRNRNEYYRIKGIDNILDRNVEYLKFLGFSDIVMQNWTNILSEAQKGPLPDGKPKYLSHWPVF